MADFSSSPVSLSSSNDFESPSATEDDIPDSGEDILANIHQEYISDSESVGSTIGQSPRSIRAGDSEDEGGLFVPADRPDSPASIITLSVPGSDDDRSIASQPDSLFDDLAPLDPVHNGHPWEEPAPWNDVPIVNLDDQGQGARGNRVELDLTSVEDYESDSDEHDQHDVPDAGPILNGHGHYFFDDIDLDDEEDDLDYLDFDLDRPESLNSDWDEVDQLNLPQAQQQPHHQQFRHPILPAPHPHRQSPGLLGANAPLNPLQHLVPQLNFLPPHLHDHLQRANSLSPASMASPRGNMARQLRNGGRDELVGVEIGGQNGNGNDRNLRGRAPPVIDLTADDDDGLEVVGSQNARRQQSQRRDNAPRLNRSDSNYMGHLPVIDISSDSDDDIQVHQVNNAPAPQARHHHHHHHHQHHRHHPPHLRHNPPPHHHHMPVPRRIPAANNGRPAGGSGLFGFMGDIFNNLVGVGNRHQDDLVMLGQARAANILPVAPNIGQIHLNYVAHPFNHNHNHGAPAGPQKPPHVPPPKARDNFTRDTGDDKIFICPSCELELAYDPDDSDENGPPAKKARTKRDKAEHHFWAVKECGHVYCRACYDNRRPTPKTPAGLGFKASPLNKKKTLCAVEGCESDVSNKSSWVGIFL